MNTIKLLDSMNDKDGNMTELYRISRPKHYAVYFLISNVNYLSRETENAITSQTVTDIRGISLFSSTNAAYIKEYLQNYKLDKK